VPQNAFDELDSHRLNQMRIESRVPTTQPRFICRIAGYRDDAQTFPPVLPAEDARQLIAVDARHAEIEKYDFRLEALRRFNGEERIGDERGFGTHYVHEPHKAFRSVWVVVDD